MAFFLKALFALALVYAVQGGIVSDHHDSYLSPPPPQYGAPSASGFAPPPSHTHAHFEASDAIVSAPAQYDAPIDHHAHSYAAAAAPIATAPVAHISGGFGGGFNAPAASLSAGPLDAGLAAPAGLGQPRVIGTHVSVGRPVAHASRYELQQVVQDVVRRVPVEVTKHIKVAVPVPQPYPVRKEIPVPVPQPYPVHVDVVKHVPYAVWKTKHVEVERPVPYEVVRHVPFEVIRKVPVPVDRPYEVIKKIPVPIEKTIEVPVPVWKPYPIHIIKHVTHYEKKKHCCW